MIPYPFMTIRILYGIKNKRINVTEICMNQLNHNNIITIPMGDYKRALLFSDPLIGIEKKIFIVIHQKEYEYGISHIINIDLSTLTVHTKCDNEVNNKLAELHCRLKLVHGSLEEEFPEQKMAVRYLTGEEKVLEIGSNVGRNSLIIASIVNQSTFVTMECDSNTVKELEENRNQNGYTFHIENAALSKRKLIQKSWDTKPSEELEEGYTWVNTITWDELTRKYSIEFDTLVLDCEGAFYYILMDMPEILQNIKLIIMENDYHDASQKKYVDSILQQYGFHNVYKEAGGWGCCFDCFFEVWKKN